MRRYIRQNLPSLLSSLPDIVLISKSSGSIIFPFWLMHARVCIENTVYEDIKKTEDVFG